MSEAPAATSLRCRGWRQEAILRLLENNLAIAEDPEHLVVYAAHAKAARDRPSLERIVAALMQCSDGQTLVVQSGKPIAILPTGPRSPVVLLANGNLVGRWATPETFYELERRNLLAWGGLTAGCWQYIGSQGVLQGTYETFAEVARRALRRLARRAPGRDGRPGRDGLGTADRDRPHARRRLPGRRCRR